MPQVPSSRWKVSDIMSAVREMSNTIDQKKVIEKQGEYFYKLAISEIVSLLNSSTDPSYFASKSLTVTDNMAIISDVMFDRIVAIEDTVLGIAIYKNPDDFLSLLRDGFSHSSYDKDLVWTQFGNIIRFRAPAGLTQGNKIMWYQRQPNYPTNWTTDAVDLADKWMPLLIKRIYSYIVIQNTSDIPNNLYQDMQNDYQQIAAYVDAEFANTLKDGKQIRKVRIGER